MGLEMYKTLEAIKRLTATNLQKEFEILNDFCMEAVNFANRCDTHVALKDLVFAQQAAHRLREDAERRFIDGLITKDEYVEIADQSLTLIYEELTAEIMNSIVKSCDCKRGEVQLQER